MLDFFLFVGLPYLAIFMLVFGSIYRYRTSRYSYSALSSQFLESRRLLWGSVPWHIGIGILLAGHLVAFLFPGFWASLTADPTILYTVEAIGVAAAVLAIAGLAVLLLRRLTSARLQAVTTTMDLVIVVLLLLQVIVGLGVATQFRWGAKWSTGTTTPYLWSLLTFHPDPSFVSEMPVLIRIHLVGAWLIFLLVPFSRLVHLFSLPFVYLFRPPQKVVWANPRRFAAGSVVREVMESRRYFLKGAVGLSVAAVLLSAGVTDKLFRFFRGPKMTPDEESQVLANRLERLEMTAEQRRLELERLRSPYIFVARMNELKKDTGKYFTDYQMRPAMAFLDDRTGLPLLISAKCTHLGCTVGNHVDAEGLLLCPCHMSYFNVHTGVPLPGSPAKAPLPLLGWVVMDSQGKIVASHAPGEKPRGKLNPTRFGSYRVFIARRFAKELA